MKDGNMLNSLKDKIQGLMGSGVGKQLEGISFPISKENLLVQLEKKGVPGAVVNKVRKIDTTQYDSLDELKKKLGL